MHHFQGTGGAQNTVVGVAEQPRRLDQQKRPQPFAAAEAGIAHGIEQMGGPGKFAGEETGRQKLVEPRLDFGGNCREMRVKGVSR